MSDTNISEKAVEEAMGLLSLHFPGEYSKLESHQKKHVMKEAKQKADELLTLAKNAKNDTTWEAFGHLEPSHIDGIKDSLKIKTFDMNFHESDGKTHVRVTTENGSDFRPMITLSEAPHVKEASTLLMASIVVECIIFILNLIGISVPNNEETVRRGIQGAITALDRSAVLVKAVQSIKDANIRGDTTSVATGILSLVGDVFREGYFWEIVKSILSGMHWYDWLIASGKIAAFIAALCLTAGIAEIAKLVSMLIDATFFIKKLVNLAKLDDM